MLRLGRPAAVASFALVALNQPTNAQDADNGAAAAFEAAQPLSRPPPDYPWSSRVGGKEGWVLVSYVVSALGEVTEPMIEDSSGREDLERAALAGVTAWRYSPARQNGQPVEQSMTKVRIVYQLDGGGAPGARSSFRNQYRKIVDLIAARDFAKAAPLIDELEFGERANLYEDAWFWWLKSSYLEASGSDDLQLKRKALRLAIGYEADYLPADQFVAAAQALYVLELRLGNVPEVLRVHERLLSSKLAKESKHYEPVLAALAPSRQQIQQAIEGDSPLVFLGEIGNHNYWVHDLLRRSFSLSRVVGNVESVDIRCSRGTKRYDSFSEDNVWNVPESWGDCGVYIKGTPGTTLALAEHPAL